MKRTAGVSLVLAAMLIIGAILATPASARFGVRYKGTTSADTRVGLLVQKNDHGKRRVTMSVRIESTCEDGSTDDILAGISVEWIAVAADGTFSFHDQSEPGSPFDSSWLDLSGDLGFHHAEGTFEFRYASLTADGQAQLCGTGPLTWTAERQVRTGKVDRVLPDKGRILTFR